MSDVSAKREEILDVAARLFARYGLRKTTVADVVRNAGVARATVYKHFSTKEDIFRAVIHREIGDIMSTVRQAVEEEGTARERLRTALLTHMAEIRGKVNLYRLTTEALSDVLPGTHVDAEEMRQGIHELYSWILSEGVKSGEIEVDDILTTAWSIVLAFKGVFMTTLTGQMQDVMPHVVETLLDLVWNGLKPREETA
ncbi:MAG: TetR/AcrR family transcriptional regulator [Candidatus Eisenbacteria bacterium]